MADVYVLHLLWCFNWQTIEYTNRNDLLFSILPLSVGCPLLLKVTFICCLTTPWFIHHVVCTAVLRFCFVFFPEKENIPSNRNLGENRRISSRKTSQGLKLDISPLKQPVAESVDPKMPLEEQK